MPKVMINAAETKKHIDERKLTLLKVRLHGVSVEEAAALLGHLPPAHRAVVFRLLPKDTAVAVFDAMNVVGRRELLGALTSTEAAELFSALEPPHRVELLDELPARVANHLLAGLTPAQREQTAILLGHERGTVGRNMSPDFVDVEASMTVAQALDRIRSRAKGKPREFQRVYVTEDTRRLVGAIPVSALVTADPGTQVEQLLPEALPSVASAWEDAEAAARRIEQLELPELPVVDREGRLTGVFRASEAMDALRAEATRGMYVKVGLLDLTQRESDRSARLLRGAFATVVSVRVPFLIVTLIGGILAGMVIDRYEEFLASVTALAFFIPVIMDMGENVGTQSSTIFTRGLVLGQISVRRFLRHLGREVLYGLGMGLMFGALGGLVAYLWQGNPALGLVVGISLTLTITVAAGLGFLIPYLFVRLGLDQAAGVDPIITTIKDIAGLLIYFTSVSLFLPQLIG